MNYQVILLRKFLQFYLISLFPGHNKRQPMFPSKKWFLEKYLKIKQNFKKTSPYSFL